MTAACAEIGDLSDSSRPPSMSTTEKSRLKPVDSADHLAQVRDPVQPGLALSRKKSLRIADEFGSAPLIWNSWLNKGRQAV